MDKKTYFIKSLPKSFHGIYHDTDKSGRPVIGQTVENILETFELQPNVRSFWLEKRICFSVLSTLYPKAFRPQGVIFTLREKNDDMTYIGHDLLALVKNYEEFDKDTAHNLSSLHNIYNDILIEPTILKADRHRSMADVLYGAGRDKYGIEISTGKKLTLQESMMDIVNAIRIDKGYKPLSAARIDKFQTNEVFSYSPVKIEPVAIYADRYDSDANQKAWKIAQRYKLPYYESLNSFLEENPHNYGIDDANDIRKMKVKSQIIEMMHYYAKSGVNIHDPQETVQSVSELIERLHEKWDPIISNE